jgi:hypothetical protein
MTFRGDEGKDNLCAAFLAEQSTQHLAVTLGTALSESLSSFTASRHVC